MITTLTSEELTALEEIEKKLPYRLRGKAEKVVARLKNDNYLTDLIRHPGDPEVIEGAVNEVRNLLDMSKEIVQDMIHSGNWPIEEFAAIRDRGNSTIPMRTSGFLPADSLWSRPDSNSPTSPRLSEQESLPSVQPPSTRQEVLSTLMAKEAEQNEDLLFFRSLVRSLHGGKLLEPHEIEAWIQEEAIFEPLPGSSSPERAQLTLWSPVLNDPNHVYTRRVSGRGNLYDLAKLSNQLATEFHWFHSAATSFILSGASPPVVQTISARINLDSRRVMSRFALEIDPALTPQEVAQEYAHIRQMIVPQKKKAHHLSKKTLRLAEFAGIHPQSKGIKGMKEWNKQWEETQPEWRYNPHSDADRGNFSRDCKNALQHVLNPDYQSPE